MFLSTVLALTAVTAFRIVAAQTESDWQWTPDIQLAGCQEVGCPNITWIKGSPERDWDVSNCSVAGRRGLGAVGIAQNVFDVPSNDAKLSLTVGRTLGVSTDYPNYSLRDMLAFEHRFMIGIPPGFDLAEPDGINAGCLLVWQQAYHTFYALEGGDDDERSNRSTCPGLNTVPESCFEHINDVVGRFEYEETEYLPFCQALAQHVVKSFSGSGLVENANGSRTGCTTNIFDPRFGNNLTGIAFLGPNAPSKIIKPGDSESNCHPTLPNSYELADLGMMQFLIANRFSDAFTSPIQNGLDGEIPVMSVIFKEDNTTTVQMACTSVQGNPKAEKWPLVGAGIQLRPASWMIMGAFLGLFLLFV